jgi:hypothetical protein
MVVHYLSAKKVLFHRGGEGKDNKSVRRVLEAEYVDIYFSRECGEQTIEKERQLEETS